MSVFFNGRLLTTPTTESVIDDSAMANQNISVGNILLMIGRSSGGKPATDLHFGSPGDAIATLKSGELLDAVLKGFDPSPEVNGPSEIIAVRINPATQASYALLDDASNPSLALKSTDYGIKSNQVKFKVETGTSTGKKLTTQIGDDYFTDDNVHSDAFSVQYTGAEATGVMTIDNTSVVLQAPTGTTIATIDLNLYDTVIELVDRINSETGFSASVLDGNDNDPALNGLDAVTAVDIKTALYTAKADLYAVTNWMNGIGEGFVDATRDAAGGAPPANIGWTYLAGGSDGTVTNSEWSDAFTLLQGVDAQWVVPVTSDAAVHAMADAHCAFMSGAGKRERRCFVGGATGQGLDAAVAAAKLLASDRSSQVWPGHYDYDALGKLTLRPSYMTAAIVAGGFAGSAPGVAMTNKVIKIRGLEVTPKNPVDTDKGINGGVLMIEDTAEGFKVVKSITTWLKDDNYNRVEVSTGAAVDFSARNFRDSVDRLRGGPVSPESLVLAKSYIEARAAELSRPGPGGPGVLVGDDENPPWKNVVATGEGDSIRIELQCSPVIPANYILLTIHAVPFSGTAS